MKAYLLNLWDDISTSYWLVPALFAIGALLLSFVIPAVDATIAAQAFDLPGWVRVNADTARATLSAIAGAMVAVTGTVFSITILTLSMTSQQFGPRLIRRFMYDMPTKITLGLFIATGFYCLLVLRVGQQAEVNSPYHLSVLVAVVMAVISMMMLIVFIHHVAMLIQAPQVVASVAEDLHLAIDRLFPERRDDQHSLPFDLDDDCMPESSREEHDGASDAPRADPWKCNGAIFTIRSIHEGYIQAIDYETLRKVAAQSEAVIRLLRRPGHFVCEDTPLAEVCSYRSEKPVKGDDPEPPCHEEDLSCHLNESVIVGNRRTPRQDVECVVDELVEVAVRALSPGINDPFTATDCIDRLAAALGKLAKRPPLPSRWQSEDGRLCLVTHPVNFGSVLDAAFDQIRQYGADSVSVVVRLLEGFDSIAMNVRRERDRKALRKQIDMVARLGDDFPAEHDRRSVAHRAETARDRLKTSDGGESQNSDSECLVG